jgi:Domain of unknown function (DUF4333)
MRSLVPPAALLAALALGGCATTDGSDAESELERSVEEELRVGEVDVDCPDDRELVGGTRFECRAKVDGRRGVLVISRGQADGPVRWRLKPAMARQAP